HISRRADSTVISTNSACRGGSVTATEGTGCLDPSRDLRQRSPSVVWSCRHMLRTGAATRCGGGIGSLRFFGARPCFEFLQAQVAVVAHIQGIELLNIVDRARGA